jgi:hypothetical protein
VLEFASLGTVKRARVYKKQMDNKQEQLKMILDIRFVRKCENVKM